MKILSDSTQRKVHGFSDSEYHEIAEEVSAFVYNIHLQPHLGNNLDIIFTIEDQSIEIGVKRPAWYGKSSEFFVLPSAQITYVRAQKAWKLYWMRAGEKWELYETADTLTKALDMVHIDSHGCFFGMDRR